ncbi:two-component sensor histidine kinase [Microvirga flocculans]|uniref:histidine kinase n=1 Tax=Microvirga flocculans TaxID=217168 RepID=A0A7W6IE70_9HYPH|nr:PAS domain-containing sensor histidine kinase [Microvirga flocculans]MBB4039830.1 two-component sensor histidine kinase [Microvirga flocculans]
MGDEALRAELADLRALFRQAPGYMAVLRGPEHVFALVNDAFRRTVGERELIGQAVREAMPELAGQGFFELLDEVYATGRPFVGHQMPMMLQRQPDGPVEQIFLDFVYQPIIGADGAVSGMFIEGSDVTARVRAAEYQQLLVNELNHRVKNTLATVQSIVSQTLRNAPTPPEARAMIEQRMIALSRAHDVLTQEKWEGADMRAIVAQALAPFRDPEHDRLHVRGPGVRLSPRIALDLAMALHELATNAVKHGALSGASGRIELVWRVDSQSSPPRLKLRWRELGGPAVEPPRRRGFGTRLIERSLAQDLGGEARIDFAPTGVVCSIDTPVQ